LSKKEPHPGAEAFAQFVLSQAGQQLIAETYIPIKET
jgi:ABC-type phosphate transport system substrate-binding protein